ncbi:hypothetical protein ASG59_07760 [Methylobacterium sp. Leaf466]|nr:hypothetical protein ASG59_07760 [Methylobacterium sp. Leaf466]
MTVRGFSIPCPAPLAAVFERQATITLAELARLLPMDPETLRGHIRRGHISYVQIGFGERAPRRVFTLDAVLRFLEDRSRTECLSTSGPARRRTATTSSVEGGDFLALLEREAAERQRPSSGAGNCFLDRLDREAAERQKQSKGTVPPKPSPGTRPRAAGK